MPLYDYTCKKCEVDFEARRTIEERKDAPCPKCGKPATQRITNPQHVKTYGIGYHHKDTGDFA